ncbi:hypothetical protein RB595_000127 [Gaeumannomyces hyphopodioides]
MSESDSGCGASAFPQFALLPAELRCRVWHYFLATVAEPRVLDFQFRLANFDDCRWKVLPGRYLAARVRSANAALATNHECRQLALKAFPDTLAIKGETVSGLVRLDKTKDVVAARITAINTHLGSNSCTRRAMREFGPFLVRRAKYIVPGCSDHVELFAVDQVDFGFDREGLIWSMDGDDSRTGYLWGFIGTFRNLKTLYRLLDHRVEALRDIHWCGSVDAVNTYETAGPARVAYGRTRQVSITAVWPDPDGHPDFARARVKPPMMPLTRMLKIYDEKKGVEEDFWDMFAGVELYPMVQFDGKSSQRVLKRLRDAPCCDDLPDEEAPGLSEPSCVATVDCDDPEGCLDHSVDGDLRDAQEDRALESKRDWGALNPDIREVGYGCRSEDFTWGSYLGTTRFTKRDPFDLRVGNVRYTGDRPLRDYPPGDLRVYTEGTDEMLDDFEPTEAVEQWLEGICQDEGIGTGEQDIVADLAECRLEVEAAQA